MSVATSNSLQTSLAYSWGPRKMKTTLRCRTFKHLYACTDLLFSYFFRKNIYMNICRFSHNKMSVVASPGPPTTLAYSCRLRKMKTTIIYTYFKHLYEFKDLSYEKSIIKTPPLSCAFYVHRVKNVSGDDSKPLNSFGILK